jgi:16S rRNA (cytosine967-C5)-methyltransferase
MPVSPARATAFDILLRIDRQNSYASELLHSQIYGKLSEADHALATELVMGILRWRSRLDFEIASASSQPLTKLDLEILIALRLAAYQFWWLDRIPRRAALHESVELVKRARKRSAAPFVNAVLRKLSTRTSMPDFTEKSVSPEALASHWAHPQWLVERWIRAYGVAQAEQICRHDQTVPVTAIRLRSEDAANELIDEGISLEAGALLSSARRVARGDVTKTRAFREGNVTVQDEASQLAAALVGRDLGERTEILDCCAAPGGKSLVIADRNPRARLTAMDLHPQRARLLQKLVRSARIHVVAGDATRLPTGPTFDRVLADVPCSGTGTLARNPEIKWRLKPEDLLDLQSRQRAILLSAMAHTAPSGRVVYSTCSLEREENEDVIDKALAQNDSFRVLEAQPELESMQTAGDLIWPDAASLTRGSYLRTIPGVHPCDGFFAAVLERK